jgi:hypothetical protein
VTGSLVEESNGSLVLERSGRRERIDLADVASRVGPVSGMPPMGLSLSPRDLRDLVAYLETL